MPLKCQKQVIISIDLRNSIKLFYGQTNCFFFIVVSIIFSFNKDVKWVTLLFTLKFSFLWTTLPRIHETFIAYYLFQYFFLNIKEWSNKKFKYMYVSAVFLKKKKEIMIICRNIFHNIIAQLAGDLLCSLSLSSPYGLYIFISTVACITEY